MDEDYFYGLNFNDDRSFNVSYTNTSNNYVNYEFSNILICLFVNIIVRFIN